MVVSGIVMLSPLLDGGLTFGGTRLALGAALRLTSLAAAELERKGIFSKEKLAEAEHFALHEYLTTLAGPPPQGDAAHAFYARVAEITGLPEDAIARSTVSSATAMSKISSPASTRSSAITMRPSRSTIRIRTRSRRAAPIRCLTAWCAPMAGRSPPMRATSSASRPR